MLLTQGEVTCHAREPAAEQQISQAAESVEEQPMLGVQVSTAASTSRCGWRQSGHRDIDSPGCHTSRDSSHSPVTGVKKKKQLKNK